MKLTPACNITAAAVITFCFLPDTSRAESGATLWQGSPAAAGEPVRTGKISAGLPTHLVSDPRDALTVTSYQEEILPGFPQIGWKLAYNPEDTSGSDGLFYTMTVNDSAWDYDSVFVLRFDALAMDNSVAIDAMLAGKNPWENAGGVRLKAPRLQPETPARFAVVLNRLEQSCTLKDYGEVTADARTATILVDNGAGWGTLTSAALESDGTPITGFRLLFVPASSQSSLLYLAEMSVTEVTP